MPETTRIAVTGDSAMPKLWIIGIASHFPPYSITPEVLDKFTARFYDVEKPSLKHFLAINRKTGIEQRSSISSYESGLGCQGLPPDIQAIEACFRQTGVDMAVRACRKALRDGGCTASGITHTIAVTSTSHGCPGYDVLVAQKLGLAPTVESILLHGVGCAGGLSVMRTAADIAYSASMRGRAARVLVFACEIFTTLLRYDLAAAEGCTNLMDLNPAAAVLSDASAAFVLCNDAGVPDFDPCNAPHGHSVPGLQLVECKRTIVPDTFTDVGFFPDVDGYRTVLAKGVVLEYIKEMIKRMLPPLLASYRATVRDESLEPKDFDWALHPGSSIIVDGIKDMLGLDDDHIRVTNEVYRTRGNSGSASVLVVLGKLLSTGLGRKHIIAVSYGPGVSVEMATLKRHHQDEPGQNEINSS